VESGRSITTSLSKRCKVYSDIMSTIPRIANSVFKRHLILLKIRPYFAEYSHAVNVEVVSMGKRQPRDISEGKTLTGQVEDIYISPCVTKYLK